MDADIQVKILLLVAAAAAIWAFAVSWQATTRFRRMVDWIRATYPERWNALPWTLRSIGRAGAVENLRRGGLEDDPEFARRYREYRRLNRRLAVLIAAGALPIAIVLAGTKLWGWRL